MHRNGASRTGRRGWVADGDLTVAMDAAGNRYFAWRRNVGGRRSRVVAATWPAGGRPRRQVALDTPEEITVSSPQLAAAGDGHAAIVWQAIDTESSSTSVLASRFDRP